MRISTAALGLAAADAPAVAAALAGATLAEVEGLDAAELGAAGALDRVAGAPAPPQAARAATSMNGVSRDANLTACA
ncbi:MAG TPA: hypothetical protein VMW62_15980 [Chloroflexota bacterium]|nr:hypothetical protein [Chloroflexota bacterium]